MTRFTTLIAALLIASPAVADNCWDMKSAANAIAERLAAEKSLDAIPANREWKPYCASIRGQFTFIKAGIVQLQRYADYPTICQRHELEDEIDLLKSKRQDLYDRKVVCSTMLGDGQ